MATMPPTFKLDRSGRAEAASILVLELLETSRLYNLSLFLLANLTASWFPYSHSVPADVFLPNRNVGEFRAILLVQVAWFPQLFCFSKLNCTGCNIRKVILEQFKNAELFRFIGQLMLMGCMPPDVLPSAGHWHHISLHTYHR